MSEYSKVMHKHWWLTDMNQKALENIKETILF